MAKRSASDSDGDMVSVEKMLSRGDWYIAVLNDDATEARTLRAVVGEQRWRPQRQQQRPGRRPSSNGGCAGGCGGRGQCVDGRCRCQPQFSGVDCSISEYYVHYACPIALFTLDRTRPPSLGVSSDEA